MNEETQQNNDEVVQVEAAIQTDNPQRIFKTGSTIISEAPEMRELGIVTWNKMVLSKTYQGSKRWIGQNFQEYRKEQKCCAGYNSC